MADQPLYQILGPDGQPKIGAVAGPEWLRPDETLGPQIDTSGKGLAPAGLQAATPPQQQPGLLSAVIPSAEAAQPAGDLSQFGLTPAGGQPPAAPAPAQGGPPTVTVTAKAPPAATQPPAKAAGDLSQFGLAPGAPTQPPPTTPPPTPTTPPVLSALAPPARQAPPPAAAPQGPLAPPASPLPAVLAALNRGGVPPSADTGSLAAFANAIPRGALGGRTIDYGSAALQTPFRMALGGQGPGPAFQQGLNWQQQTNQGLTQAYPATSTAGEVAGGLGAGLVAAPYLGWRAASSALPRIGQGLSYLGRNAGAGALMSYLNYGDPTTGAVIGGTLPAAHMVGSAAKAPFNWAYRQLSPLWSQAAQDRSLGSQLGGRMAGSPVQTSPVGPLDLAQATNNPDIAAMTEIAGNYNAPAVDALRQQQKGAVGQQIAQIGTPTGTAAASSAGTEAIRNLERMSNARERELWTHPALTDFAFKTQGLKDAAAASLRGVQRDDPGLLLGMTGMTHSTLEGVANMPERANLANINSYISNLKAIVRNPPAENPRAGALAGRLLGDLEKARDATVNASGAPSNVMIAYNAARDFTRRAAAVFGTQDMRSVLAKNPAGLFKAKPSKAMQSFFDFARGSPEGPRNLAALQQWADEIKQAWVGRGSMFDQLVNQRDTLRDAARSYVTSALAKSADNPAELQKFLATNRDWMGKSGLFSTTQMDAADKLLDYAGMLRRPALLQHQTNSATARRVANDKTFIGQIVSPWIGRSMAIGAAGYGYLTGGVFQAMEHGMASEFGAELFNRRVANVQSVMRSTMAEALMDPAKAQALMMKASAANLRFLPPQISQWLGNVARAVGSDVAPQLNAPGSGLGAPAPAGAYPQPQQP
jgi:hypothetical protein